MNYYFRFLIGFLPKIIIFGSMIAVSGCEAADRTYPADDLWFSKKLVDEGMAFRGRWRMNRSRFYYVDDPNVEITDDGRAVVAWVNQTRKDIVLQIYSNDGTTTFDQPVNVSRSPQVFSWFPTVEVTQSSGKERMNIHVLWQEIVFSGGSHGGEAYYAVSTNGGESFTGPRNLSKSEAGDGKGRLTDDNWDNGSLDLVAGNGNDVFAVWTEYEGRLWLRRMEVGSDRVTMDTSQLINWDSYSKAPARGPSLSMDDNGELYLVWTVGEDENADIRFQRLDPEGRQYRKPSKLANDPGHTDSPKIHVDDEGIIHLVYGYAPEGMYEHYEIYYTRSKVGESSFSGAITLSDASSRGSHSANYPSLEVIDGNPVVVWELLKRGGKRSVALGYSYSKNGGLSFQDPELVPGTEAPTNGFNGSQQGKLMGKLSSNEKGDIGLVNSTFVRGDKSRIWLLRGKISP